MFEQLFPLPQYCVIVGIQLLRQRPKTISFLHAAFASILHVHVTEVTDKEPYSLPCVDFTQLTCTALCTVPILPNFIKIRQ